MRGRQFQPGKSGNPKGRPPKSVEERTAEQLARQHTPAAIAALLDIATRKGGNDRARVAAAEALLDRGWGQAKETRDVNIKRTIIEYSDAELLSFIEGSFERVDDPPALTPEPGQVH